MLLLGGGLLRTIIKAVIASLVLGLTLYVSAKVDLFGFETASAKLSDGVYQRLASDAYPGHRPRAKLEGQSRIRVVYLDETTIRSMGDLGWRDFPPTPDQQADMLQDLVAVPMVVGKEGAEPRPPAKVVFLDFMYFGRDVAPGTFETSAFKNLVERIGKATNAEKWNTRGECLASPLAKLACIVEVGGTPVILGKPEPFGQRDFTLVQDKLDKVAVMVPLLVGVDAYPMIYRDPTPYGPSARFDISPALAIYAAYCLQEGEACRDPVLKALVAEPPLPGTVRAGLKDLSVVWGSYPSPLQAKLDIATTGESDPCSAGSWVSRLIDNAFILRGPRQGENSPCAYAVSLGYDRLINTVALDRPLMARFLSNAVVLVGVQMKSGNDWIENPVHGQVPGVYYHAMALDNLMERGLSEYRRTESLLDSDLLQAVLAAVLFFVGLIALMVRNGLHAEARSRDPPERLTAPRYLAVYGLGLLASLAILGLAVWWGMLVQKTVAINWIGVAAVASGGLLIASREALWEDVSGSLAAFIGGQRLVGMATSAAAAFDFRHERLDLRKPAPATAPVKVEDAAK